MLTSWCFFLQKGNNMIFRGSIPHGVSTPSFPENSWKTRTPWDQHEQNQLRNSAWQSRFTVDSWCQHQWTAMPPATKGFSVSMRLSFWQIEFPILGGTKYSAKKTKETSSSLRYPGDSSSLSQLLGGWWIIPTCCNSRIVVVLSAFVGFADHSSQPGRTRRRRETYNFYPLSNSFKIRQKSQIPKDTTTHSWYFWFHLHVSTMCGNIIKWIFQIPVLTNEKTKFSLDGHALVVNSPCLDPIQNHWFPPPSNRNISFVSSLIIVHVQD